VTQSRRSPATVSTRPTSYATVGFDELGEPELSAWGTLRAANPALDSPYFHPGFSRAVHASGTPVEVVVARDAGGEIRALLPTHRDGGVLRPVGWPGADFQGPILAPGTTLDPLRLLTDRVRRFEFDHLVATPGFEGWIETSQVSPYLDVTGGLPGYLERASRSGKDNMAQARRRTAKAGALRFDAETVDEQSLRRLVNLKRSQYAATGARDYFAEPRRRTLLLDLLHTSEPGFAGILSTVYAGDTLVAAHFGIRSEQVLHWWFPVYNPQFANLAPGWILLRELVNAAPDLGITRIDLGRGDDEYKRRAKTGETSVRGGVVSRSSTQRALRRVRSSMIDAVKASPLGPPLRRIVRKVRSR
jgi:CelD/BcsL family acetyltransferase involved in cellulose biosynthesis